MMKLPRGTICAVLCLIIFLSFNTIYTSKTFASESKTERDLQSTSPHLPPSDSELAIVSTARQMLDNITDMATLRQNIQSAMAYLQSQECEVSLDNSTIYIRFQTGHEALLLATLETAREKMISVTLQFQKLENDLTQSVSPIQPSRFVVFDVFQWEFGGSEYQIYQYMGTLYPTYYANGYYIPNQYATLDEIANFFLGPYINHYIWVVSDNFVDHAYYGVILFSSHGGYDSSIGTFFATGETYSGTGVNDYNRYNQNAPGSVVVCTVSGDSRYWIGITTTFFYDFLYAADYPNAHSLFYADTCDGLYSTDMANEIESRAGYVYLGWTGLIMGGSRYPGDEAVNLFFNDLCSKNYDVRQSWLDVKHNGWNYDSNTGAYLYYYPSPEGGGGADHGDWYMYTPAQVTMTVSYLVVGGGNPTAPVFHYVLNGVSKSLTLTKSPTAVWADAGTTWSVTPNPLTGSSSTQRWCSNQPLTGTASSATIVFTFYRQTLQILSYSVSGGGTGYSPPTLHANQFGSPTSVTLTTTATKYWFDYGSSWTVTNPLVGSTSNERWFTTQTTTGSIASSSTRAFKYQHQFYLTMAVSSSAAGSVAPSSGWQNAGAKVSIRATAKTGHKFQNWAGTGRGSYSGTSASASVTMNSAITETATFT
jgi:hypothetical protein